jgi:ubiquinol-cytochrome c reductase iron-sulfur subunit
VDHRQEAQEAEEDRMTETSSGSEEPQNAPKRVIGTPPPAETHTLLSAQDRAPAQAGDDGGPDELDEKSARKAERVVATFFLLTFVASIAFIAAYVFVGRDGGMHGIYRAQESNYLLGSAMTVMFLGLAVGITIWVRRLMTAKPIIQERHELASPEPDREQFAKDFLEGAEASAITRRPLLRRTLLLAAAPLGLAPLILLRDLGPLPEKKLRSTYWADAVKAAQAQGKPGARLLVADTNRPLNASDFDSPGAMITVVPEGIENLPDAMTELAKASTILINVPEEMFKPLKGRENWHVGGVVAYSKICTHVGCPAALYEQTTHHILCPCHQSTFDATDGAKVIFGPAARSLPQLPITVDSEGYFVATSDYHEPVGPSFWERG